MTLLDDDIDDLLRTFRADEALLDDGTRGRMWARICDEVPDAPTAFEALAIRPGVHVLRGRPRPSGRVRLLGVAAAVLVLLAVAGLAVRTGSDDDTVAAGPTTEAPVPRTLLELADAVAIRPVGELGASDQARYTHQVVAYTLGTPGAEPVFRTEERWVAKDGTGRQVRSFPAGTDQLIDTPGTLLLGALPPDVAVSLPGDPDRVAVVLAQHGQATDRDVARTVITTLSFTGLPGPARAGLLRFLDRLGFVSVSTPGVRPNLLRVEGPGPDGSTMQADFGLLTGEVVAWTSSSPDGRSDARTYTEVDLRVDRGQ
ncbi:MAG TPA: hypothetical protein VGO60_15245 [Iamia sp.]|jgi:hypothetical protein|nr:hypothetical protein [Iamia sp.]